MADMSGPLFDGTAARAVTDFLDAAELAVADSAVNAVRAGTAAFRNPTGRYRAGIRLAERGGGQVVTDGGSRYGPWLEGVSARNRSTRFKGYHLWQTAAQRAEADAVRVAEQVLPPYLRRMGG